MKRIKKLGKAVTATLLAGATITGAAATLGDYPKPFIDDEGEVDAQIVVGENAKTVDVVGAMDIAGSLGNSAYETTTQAVSGGSFGWSASNGVTLDTRNDNLFYGNSLDKTRSTLTGEHLTALEDFTFRDDSGTETEIEHYLYPSSNSVTFGQADDDENPVIHVDNPSSVDSNNHLFSLQVNFEDGIDFTSDDVQGEDMELFGNSFTVSEDTTATELVLYGSSETMEIETGSSNTFTINGEEHTLEVVSVTGSGSNKEAAIRVDGDLRSESEDESINVDGQTVRIDDIIKTGGSDTAEGLVQFAVGSQELVLSGGDVEDGEGDDIEGITYSVTGTLSDLTSITYYIGTPNDDKEYVAAGESFTHQMFPNINFHLGGLNPDAMEESETVNEVSVSPNGDDTLSASFMDNSGDSASVEFFHTPDEGSNLNLASGDNDKIVAIEGDAVQEDEYMVTDAGDFSHMWQVSSVDSDSGTSSPGDEATVELQDQLSGQSVEVDLEAAEDVSGYTESGDDQYAGTEIIDGQTYYFMLDTQGNTDDSDDNLYVTWGTDADYDKTGSGSSGVTTAFPSIKTENDGRMAFYDPGQEPSGVTIGTSLEDFAASDNVYWNDQGTSSDVDSGDSIWIDNADDGEFNENGQIVGGSDPGTSLQEIADPVLSVEVDSPNSDTGDKVVNIPSSGRLDDPKASQEDIGFNQSTSINEDQIVELEDTGKYFIIDSTTDGGGFGTVSKAKLVGDDGDSTSGDNVKGKTLDEQQIDSQTQAGATGADAKVSGQVSFSTTGADSLSIDDGGGSGVDLSNIAAGDVLALDEDTDGDLTDSSTVFVIADTPGSSQDGGSVNSLSVIGPDGATINDNSDVYTVSQSDSGTVAFIDEEFLDSGSDIATGLNSVFPGTSFDVTADFNYNSNNRLRLQSGNTSSDSYVEVNTYSSSGTDVSGASYLDILSSGNGVESKRDQVQFGSGSVTDDSTTGSNVGSGSYLQYVGSGGFTDGDTIVEDNNGDDTYDSGDEVVGFSANVRYWSSDAEETNSVTSGLQSNLPGSKPAAVFIQDEADDDNQYSYIMTGSWDSGDSEVQVDSPTFSDSGKRDTATLESNDDVTAGYDVYGAYTEYESDGQNDFSLFYPQGQSTVGAAFTGMNGGLDASSSGSVEVNTPTGFPDAAMLDSEISNPSTNTILVGGPSVNSLVQQLADSGDTMAGSEYSEGDAMVQLVENAFGQNHAMVVAGYSGEDTRTAASYLANYQDNSEEMAGKNQVMVNTQ